MKFVLLKNIINVQNSCAAWYFFMETMIYILYLFINFPEWKVQSLKSNNSLIVN